MEEEPVRGVVTRPPPEPSGQVSTHGGPPDLSDRIYAIGTQLEELWRLNQACEKKFENLLDAINYACQHWLITAAERHRLLRINKLGNDAKHKGFGFGGCAGRAGRAASCSPVFGLRDRGRSHSPPPLFERVSSGAASSRDPAPGSEHFFNCASSRVNPLVMQTARLRLCLRLRGAPSP